MGCERLAEMLLRRGFSLMPGWSGRVREGRERVAMVGTHGAGPRSWRRAVGMRWLEALVGNVPTPSRHVPVGTFAIIGRIPSQRNTRR